MPTSVLTLIAPNVLTSIDLCLGIYSDINADKWLLSDEASGRQSLGTCSMVQGCGTQIENPGWIFFHMETVTNKSSPHCVEMPGPSIPKRNLTNFGQCGQRAAGPSGFQIFTDQRNSNIKNHTIQSLRASRTKLLKHRGTHHDSRMNIYSRNHSQQKLAVLAFFDIWVKSLSPHGCRVRQLRTNAE